MEDIGMSSDYRSGQDRPGECYHCNRQMDVSWLETCGECGHPVCPDCRTEDTWGCICLSCSEKIAEAA